MVPRHGAAAILVISLPLVLFPAAATRPAAAQPDTPAPLLVVPFENGEREPKFVWLGEAAAVLMADEMNARGVPAFTRAERVRAFEQLHLPVATPLSRATVIKVGQMLGASEVVWGSYRVAGDELTVQAYSIRVEAGRLQPAVTERGRLEDMFGVFSRLAERIAGRPRGPGTAVQPPLTAFERYIKGLLAESAAVQATFFETAIREFPAFDRARLALWQVRSEQGDHAAALTAVKGVPEDSPRAREARMRAGVSLLEQEEFGQAAEVFSGLLDPGLLQTTSPPPRAAAPVLNNLGIVQLRRGSTATGASAAYYLTRAADADPEGVDYQFNLGYAYARDRNYKAAIYWLREVVRRDAADADAHFLLSVALQATGSSVEAAREKELARQLSSKYEQAGDRGVADTPEIPSGLERVRTEIGTPRAGRPEIAIATSAQREQRDLASFHLDRGRRLFEREQDRDALVELRRAVYLSPYDAGAHLLIGRIHLRAGRPDEAVDALKISIWSEDSAPARTALAEAYLALKDVDDARREAARALELDPASTDARRLLEGLKDRQW